VGRRRRGRAVGEESFVSLVDGGELDWEFQKALGLVKALVIRAGVGLDHWLAHLRKGVG